MRKVTLSALAIALAMGLSACSSSQEESYDPSSNDVATFQPNKSSSENNSSNQSASENNSSNQSASKNDSANQTNESNNQKQSTRPHLTIIEKGPVNLMGLLMSFVATITLTELRIQKYINYQRIISTS